MRCFLQFSRNCRQVASIFQRVRKLCDIAAANHTEIAASLHLQFLSRARPRQKLHLKVPQILHKIARVNRFLTYLMLSHLVVLSSFKFFSVPLSNRGPPLVLKKNGGRLNRFSLSLNPCGFHCKFSFSENVVRLRRQVSQKWR